MSKKSKNTNYFADQESDLQEHNTTNLQSTHFEHTFVEKRGNDTTEAFDFLTSVWGSNVNRVKINSDEKLVYNDIYRKHSEYKNDISEEPNTSLFEKLHIREKKLEKDAKSDAKEAEIASSSYSKEMLITEVTSTKVEDNQSMKDRFTTSSLNTKRDDNVLQDLMTDSPTPMQKGKQNENVFSNDLKISKDIKEETSNIEHNVLREQSCTSHNYSKVKGAPCTADDDENGKTIEEENTEEELKFKEMMSTFDKLFPDDNDSSTLYEIVFKQGFKTKTRELLEAMQEFAASNGFEMKDGHPNGNCMFHAIHDQLIINGNFRFDEMSLRQKAVSYLKLNPKNKEGIPLECFLINEESWDCYLARMSKFKVWGDHLIIKALCEVLKRKIIVHSLQSSEHLNTYEFEPEKSDTEWNDDLHLGHLGELHYMSLRPSNWKQSWISKIIHCKEENQNHLTNFTGFGNEMLMTDYGFDPISNLRMPLFSTLFFHLMLLSQTMLLRIPSKIRARHDFQHIETAGGRSDGTECFYKQKDPILHTAEYNHRFDSECPLMILVSDDQPVSCGADAPRQEKFIFAETENCHPGYCRLLRQSYNRRVYLHGWNVMPHLDPNETTAKRSVAGHPCHDWPHSAEEWLTRETVSNWPGSTLRTVISDAGCIVAQIAHPASSTPEIEWRFLFNKAEMELMEAVPRQKSIYYIFKLAVDFFTKNLKVRLHNVHLRSIFFYACEKLHKTEFHQFPGYCFLYMIHNLLNHLVNRFLPNYFIKENNMIDHYADQDISHLQEMVELIRIFPIQSLLFLLKEHGHQRSWIMDIVNSSPNKALEIDDIIIPTIFRLAQNLAKDEEFHSSYRKIEEVNTFFSLMPFYKNGKRLPAPSMNFLVRECTQNLDEYTKCRLTQVLEDGSRPGMFPSEMATKKVKDLMGGTNIADLGEKPVPPGIAGDTYYEANYLNSLGVELHNNEGRYEDAAEFFISAIELVEKSVENLTDDINHGGPDGRLAERYQKLEDCDSLCFICFQNVSKSCFDSEIKDRIKAKMHLLETICKRSFGQDKTNLVKKLWDRIGFKERD